MNHPEIDRLISRYRDLSVCRTDIGTAADLLSRTFRAGGLMLSLGHGASSFIAEQFVSSLLQRPRPVPAALRSRLEADHGERGERLASGLQGGLPALALTGPGGLFSAIAAGAGTELIYAQQVYSYARSGDALVIISSGQPAPEHQAALRLAGSLGLHRIVLCGREAEGWQGLADCLVRVPRVTATEVQELHLPVCNALAVMLEQEFFL